MKISVIIATKNRLNYLFDLLEDLQLQNQKVDEVVISDQSDFFIKIDKQYTFNLVHFQNFGEGPCVSRNDAVNKASGDVLVFLDDDARIATDFIFEITNPIVNNQTFVCSGAVCDINGNFVNKKDKNDHWFIKLTLIPDKKVKECFYTPAGCTAILKSVFYKIGQFDTYFDPNGAGEDREFAMRLVKSGYQIYFNPNAKLLHIGAPSGGRRSNGNTTLEFQKNIGFIIYKYYGLNKLYAYRFYLINQRLKQIITFKLPMYHLEMLFKSISVTNPRSYKVFFRK